MRVEATKQAAYRPVDRKRRDSAPAAARAESRALVVQSPAVAYHPAGNYRPAAFLAHLIATKDQLPQTRERRRAEPGEAIAAYRAVEAMMAQRRFQ